MREGHILAIDQGTTGTTVLVFDRDAALVGRAYAEFTQHYPQGGWVEHDPEEIWRVTETVAGRALQAAGIGPQSLAGIGITNQRETVVMWDRATGRPVHRAIVWQDRRTAPVCDRLRADGRETEVRERTGLVIDPYFSGTKVAWLLDNVAGLRRRAEAGEIAFGTVDSWLVWKLTGGAVHVTDVSNASRTLLYNIFEQRWDESMLALLDVPPSVLPTVRPSSEVYGHTRPGGAFGDRPVPVAGIAGDQQAALFGQACHAVGMAKNTYGTGSFVLMNTGTQAVTSHERLLTTVAWQLAGQPMEYALEGAIFVTGAGVQWLRDGLGLIGSAAETDALAASVPDNGDLFFVPALTGLGAPHWDPYARGLIVGATRGTTRAHLARATLEAMAFQTRDVVEAMVRDSAIPVSELRADGGASANGFLMQFQADCLGVPVVVPEIAETTALGAAYLAGLATGVWPDRGALAARWRVGRRYEPAMPDDRRERLHARWLKAVALAKGWARDDLEQ
jgi:glycerol kinase